MNPVSINRIVGVTKVNLGTVAKKTQARIFDIQGPADLKVLTPQKMARCARRINMEATQHNTLSSLESCLDAWEASIAFPSSEGTFSESNRELIEDAAVANGLQKPTVVPVKSVQSTEKLTDSIVRLWGQHSAMTTSVKHTRGELKQIRSDLGQKLPSLSMRNQLRAMCMP